MPLPQTEPSPRPKRDRDPRIDAFRGLALVMILIDHMPGNPYEALTLRNFGFSDAAEAFFVMSGIAAGIAYSGAILRWQNGEGRLWPAIVPLWHRAWTLYLVQLLLTVSALALFAWAAETFRTGDFRRLHNLGMIYSDTSAALMGLVKMSYQIGYVNILPAYMVLLLATPAILAALLRAPWITLAVSLLVWLVGGWLRLNVPNNPGGGGWFFSPLSWQAIFVVGLAIGIRHRQGLRLVPVSRPLFWGCVALLAFVLLWIYVPGLAPIMNHKLYQLGSLGAPWNMVSHDKTFLGLPRLVHILALVYVISCLPMIRTLCLSPALEPLRLMGRQGLLVFSIGTILALAGQILFRVEPNVAWLPWVVPMVAVLLCYIAAWLRQKTQRMAGGTGVSPSSPMRRT